MQDMESKNTKSNFTESEIIESKFIKSNIVETSRGDSINTHKDSNASQNFISFDSALAGRFFKIFKKYIRQKDMNLYLRCKAISKDDMDFIEQMALIHLKNIALDSKIAQNLYGTLDNFVFNTLFKRHFFSSFEMFRIFLYRMGLSQKLMLKDVTYHLKNVLKSNIKQIKINKKTKNALCVLEPLASMPAQAQNYIKEICEILSSTRLKKIDNVLINPLNIIANPYLMDKKTFISEFSTNLKIILESSNAKMITLDNTHEFFCEMLECIESCASEIVYPISVGISIPSYHLDSINMAKYAIKISENLVAKKKARIILRLKDIDVGYEYENFISQNSHKPNENFTNHTNIISNLISIMQLCNENRENIEYYIASNNIFILSMLKDSNISVEIDKELNYPCHKLCLKEEINVINMQYYTTNFTLILPHFLKNRYFYLCHNLFDIINMLMNEKGLEKYFSAFKAGLNNAKNNINNAKKSLEDSKDLRDNLYNFEVFDYELEKPLIKEFNSIQNIKNIESNAIESKSFLDKLDIMSFITPSENKLQDLLYLNPKDMHRLSMQGLSNIPVTFSLNTQKEKDALELAYKKQDEILSNRINIIISILAKLKEDSQSLFDTLCEVYPHTPPYILESQIYVIIDTFKYYAYEYKILLNQTKSVLIMNIGNIFVDTKELQITEIASIIAANIMIGNVSMLSDSLNARILYYMFESVFEFCPFMSIIESNLLHSNKILNNQNVRIITSKNESEKYDSNNLLVWDKGELVVFISSFFDFYEACLGVLEMKYFSDKKITIYTDEYIYDIAKMTFIPLQVINISLYNLVQNLNDINISKNVSNFSIFTYNKTEINYVLNHINISMQINAVYKYRLITGSTRVRSPGLLASFGSNILLTKLLLTSPNSVIKNNSLYSDIIGCFSAILSVDEVEFLYNLNHNYTQFLEIQNRQQNNIYERNKPYNMQVRVYPNDDFFHICVIMLIAFLLEIKTKISFSLDSIESSESKLKKSEIVNILDSNLKEKYIDIFTLCSESEEDFLAGLKAESSPTLVRIMQDESEFSSSETYKEFCKLGIIAEYSLPILNKNLELIKYIYPQYIKFSSNFLLETNLSG